MNAKEFLNNVCKEIKYKPANKPIADELEAHIEDIKTDNLCKGYSEQEAEEKAVEQMGDAKQIGKKLNKIHRPKLDWKILVFVFILILLGGNYHKLFMIDVFWEKGFLGLNDFITAKVEYIIMILSIVFCICIYFYDYRRICKYSKIIYVIATLLNVIAYIRGFRTNGNLIYGLWPFVAVSSTVFSIPLYIIAFAGFLNDINKENKIHITISNGKKVNTNIVLLIILSLLSVITSLMISFVSGFLLTMVYLIISTIQLLKRKQVKNTAILLGISIIVFVLFSTIICIIPTRRMYYDSQLISSYWVGVKTAGKRRIEFVRSETLKAAKLVGQADLKNIPLKDSLGYSNTIQNFFSGRREFAFLSSLSRYGWIASFGFELIMLTFIAKLIRNAIKIKDRYGKLITIGIASLYLVQTICNLAMNLGFGIIAEFTLPFVSDEDASLMVNMLCMALVLSVYRRKDINFGEEPKESKLRKILKKIDNFFFETV